MWGWVGEGATVVVTGAEAGDRAGAGAVEQHILHVCAGGSRGSLRLVARASERGGSWVTGAIPHRRGCKWRRRRVLRRGQAPRSALGGASLAATAAGRGPAAAALVRAQAAPGSVGPRVPSKRLAWQIAAPPCDKCPLWASRGCHRSARASQECHTRPPRYAMAHTTRRPFASEPLGASR